MVFTQVKETCLYVENLDDTESFYHGKLEMPVISKVEDRHIFFNCGSSVLLCFLNKATIQEKKLPPHFAIGRQHIALEVPQKEYAKAKEKVLAKKIQITHFQEWPGNFESFYFSDPDGHVLEIVPQGMWG